MTKDINSPRLPAFKDKSRARKAEIPVWGIESLKEFMDETVTGLKGSATMVKKIEVPAAVHREGKLFRENAGQALDEVIGVLKENKVLEVE